MNFLASPDIVTAMAFSGKLSFDPTKDSLLDSEGNPFKFDPPQGDKLPEQGFTAGTIDPFFLCSLIESNLTFKFRQKVTRPTFPELSLRPNLPPLSPSPPRQPD